MRSGSVRAVIYCRVSTKEQVENFSLETQEEQCRRYCERQELVVDRVFVEEGKSATTLNRPKLQELLEYCKRNRKHIGVVVFYAIDRASRQTRDFLQVWADLGKWGLKLECASQHIDDSPEGKLSATLICATGQYENDRKGRNNKDLMQKAFNPSTASLSFDERLGMLVDAEQLARDNRALTRRLKEAKLRLSQACLEDLDYSGRKLDRALIRQLATCRWVAEHQNILITGPTGVGKTFLACALGQQACRQSQRVIYRRMPRLFPELTLAHGDGTIPDGAGALRAGRCPHPR